MLVFKIPEKASEKLGKGYEKLHLGKIWENLKKFRKSGTLTPILSMCIPVRVFTVHEPS